MVSYQSCAERQRFSCNYCSDFILQVRRGYGLSAPSAPGLCPPGAVTPPPSEASPKAPAGPPHSLAAAGHVKKSARIISKQTHEYLPALSWLLPSCAQVTQVNRAALCPPLVIGPRGLKASWKEVIKKAVAFGARATTPVLGLLVNPKVQLLLPTPTSASRRT